jgi:peptidoglycan/xylan/chitin deacetylase (PgdA/CDA1 family)
MFLHHGITGSSLPARTVCLTYDDGPGPRTDDLARYLHDQEISACFFVMGKHAVEYPATMARMRAWGHIVGNHTFSHPGLVDFALERGDVVAEIAAAHEAIKPYLVGRHVFLRPPYGSWRQQSRRDGPQDYPTSLVADRLNASGHFPDYVGPVLWDIVGEDWDCWRLGRSPEDCATRYITATEKAGRGIILMHDSSEAAAQIGRNRTFELTQLLVPALRERGYRFAPLAAVPELNGGL